MPYCPKCKYEYNPEISKCPDCDEYLVDQLSLEPDEVRVDPNDDHQDWVPLARFSSHQQAQMLVEGLRAKEIPAVIYSSTGSMGQIGGDIIKPTKDAYTLLVLSEYIEDANMEASVMLGEIWEKSKLVDIG